MAKPFTPEDLVAIEEDGAHRQAEPADRAALLPKAEALDLFAQKGQTLKSASSEKVAGDTVQCYTMGGFIDFCLGLHLASTKDIKAFKLKAEPAAAYWKGKEGNPSMQRIYGYAFFTKEELTRTSTSWRRRSAATTASSKEPRPLLDLRRCSAVIPGHPKGGFIRSRMEEYLRRGQHFAGGYDIVYSPHIAKIDLWNTSGHTEYYKANMYSPIDIEGVEYQLKPMNCPFHIQIYRSHLRPTASCRCATRTSARSTASSGRESSTGSCACGASRRTTRTSSAGWTCSVLGDFSMRRHRDPAHLRVRAVRRLPLDEAGEGASGKWDRDGALRAALDKKGVAYQVDLGARARSTGRRST
ncbi:MAG: hypothetical protein U0599_12315 [Vicinamibacteria bacterium]